MANKIYLLYTILCFLKYVSCEKILCEAGFCNDYIYDPGCPVSSQHCVNNATHHGIELLSPTLCNCCDYCLPTFFDGQACSLGGTGDGITVGRCGAGLYCKEEASGNVCSRMTVDQSKCHGRQDDFDDRHQLGLTGALEQRPICDGKGKYAPADCVPTQTCFCQNEDGERIFGEVLYRGLNTINSMHCGCSRINNKIQNLIGKTTRQPVVGPRCTSDGNFHPIQCIGRRCHCVNVTSGAVLPENEIHLDTRHLSDLPCYDPDLDFFGHLSTKESGPPYNYTTPCYEDQKARLEILLESEAEGFNVDFASDIPECLPDGSYGRIALTRNRTRICVDERLVQIENYEALPNTEEYEKIDCKCAVTSLLMSGQHERPICCSNGNYRPIQCRRGLCRCVDSDGRQIGMENSDVTKLNCYTKDWIMC